MFCMVAAVLELLPLRACGEGRRRKEVAGRCAEPGHASWTGAVCAASACASCLCACGEPAVRTTAQEKLESPPTPKNNPHTWALFPSGDRCSMVTVLKRERRCWRIDHSHIQQVVLPAAHSSAVTAQALAICNVPWTRLPYMKSCTSPQAHGHSPLSGLLPTGQPTALAATVAQCAAAQRSPANRLLGCNAAATHRCSSTFKRSDLRHRQLRRQPMRV